MTRYKEQVYSTPEQKRLFTRTWLPEDGDPAVIVVYVHGMGSHSGRMEHWAERFTARNMGFFAYDHRGHGRSDGERGTPKKFDVLTADLRNLVHWLREAHPEKKIILYGHSLGGSIAINYVISEAYTADALITTSPWLTLTHPPSATMLRLINLLVKIAPGITLSNGLNAGDISRDPEEIAKYRNDPLIHDRICLGLFKSACDAGMNALRNVYKINCPFLIMHGTADRITSAKASENFVMNTSERARLKLWDGAFHELHHEEIRDEVFTYIADWLKEQKLT